MSNKGKKWLRSKVDRAGQFRRIEVKTAEMGIAQSLKGLGYISQKKETDTFYCTYLGGRWAWGEGFGNSNGI